MEHISKRRVLVTGGAGYIGSHTARALQQADAEIIIIDNLSTGFKANLEKLLTHGAIFYEGDIADKLLIQDIFKKHKIQAILHFAGSLSVEESVRDPLLYYHNNTAKTRDLIAWAVEYGVEDFMFSSTATVYAEQLDNPQPLHEEFPLAPVSPYGFSKFMSEQILRDACSVSAMRYGILRYFNVAGADPENGTGQRSDNATHLIKVAAETMVGKRQSMSIFGTDYPTPDGTCIRDYIHVLDLADAHLACLNYMVGIQSNALFNCGYGNGASVREVLKTIEHVADKAINAEEAPRRAGDTPYLVADIGKIKKLLGWQPKHDTLEEIVGSTLKWEQALQDESTGETAQGHKQGIFAA